MGYFRIDNLAAGTYSVGALAKGHTFTPVLVPLNADVTNLVVMAATSQFAEQ
jgi:hypothetical protein